MLTAIALGMLVLSTAAWAWKQLEALTLPAKAWSISLSQPEGAGTPGATATLYRVENDQDVKVATGVIETYATEGRNAATLTMTNVQVEPGQNMLDTRRAEVSGAAGGAPVLRAVISGRAAIPIFERVYLQAGIAGAIVLLGAFLTYKFVGRKPVSVDFLIATDEEMRKVNWSTRKIILDSTYVVIGATFLIAAYIFLFDLGLKAALFTPIVNAK
jgi:preprotein translocase SecE subunit